MKYGMLIMGCFLLKFSSALAQTPENTSLSNLYEKATSYPGLKAETNGIEVANYDYKLTKQQILPDLRLQAQNTVGTYEGAPGGFIPLPGFFNVSGSGTDGSTTVNSLVSATLKWDFLRFGKFRDQVKSARLGQEKAQNSFDLKELQLKHQLTQAYLGWMFSKYMQNWAAGEAERNRNLLELSSSRVRSGLASAADSLIAQTGLKQAIAQQKKWKASTRQYENQLFEYTGVEFQPQKAPKDFFSAFETSEGESFDGPHPLLTEKDQQREALDIEKQSVNHQVLPDVSVLAGGLMRGVGYGKDQQAFEDSYQMPINNYLVGVGLTWDLSQWYSKGLKKQKIEQQQEQVNQQRKAVERSLEQQKNSLQYQIEQSQQEIREAEAAYASAKKSYHLFRVRYESGLIDLTTLLQIQQTLQFTEKARIQAYYKYWQYWNNYAYAIGNFSMLTSVFN